MDEEDLDYRELLQNQNVEQRNIQRLEWRWARKLPKWEKATLRVQAWYRGCLGRERAKRARERRAPLLKSRRLHAIAEEAVKDGRYEEAARCLTESIEQQDSTYWQAYSLRGRIRYRAGDIPGALHDLTVCVREAPHDRAALKTRARLFASQGLWEDASRDLSAGLRGDPNDLEGYLLRGNALLHSDNYSGAVYDFGMVIDRAEVPSAADYVRRACAFCCGQNWQKALEDLDRSIATEETPLAFLLRGRVLACMRRWKLAVADFDAVLERWPDSSGEARVAREEALTPYVPLPMMSDEDAARLAAGE